MALEGIHFESRLTEEERKQRIREYNMSFLRNLEMEERFNQVKDMLVTSGFEAVVSISLTGSVSPELGRWFGKRDSDVEVRLDWGHPEGDSSNRRAIGIVMSERKFAQYTLNCRPVTGSQVGFCASSDDRKRLRPESWEFSDSLNLLFSTALRDIYS